MVMTCKLEAQSLKYTISLGQVIGDHRTLLMRFGRQSRFKRWLQARLVAYARPYCKRMLSLLG